MNPKPNSAAAAASTRRSKCLSLQNRLRRPNRSLSPNGTRNDSCPRCPSTLPMLFLVNAVTTAVSRPIGDGSRDATPYEPTDALKNSRSPAKLLVHVTPRLLPPLLSTRGRQQLSGWAATTGEAAAAICWMPPRSMHSRWDGAHSAPDRLQMVGLCCWAAVACTMTAAGILGRTRKILLRLAPAMAAAAAVAATTSHFVCCSQPRRGRLRCGTSGTRPVGVVGLPPPPPIAVGALGATGAGTALLTRLGSRTDTTGSSKMVLHTEQSRCQHTHCRH